MTAGRPSNLGQSSSMAGRAASCCWRMIAAMSSTDTPMQVQRCPAAVSIAGRGSGTLQRRATRVSSGWRGAVPTQRTGVSFPGHSAAACAQPGVLGAQGRQLVRSVHERRSSHSRIWAATASAVSPGTRPAGSTSAAGHIEGRSPRAMFPIRGTGHGALPGDRAVRAGGWDDRSRVASCCGRLVIKGPSGAYPAGRSRCLPATLLRCHVQHYPALPSTGRRGDARQ